MPETRIGFAFGNITEESEVLTSSEFAPDWGLVHSPDEVRYVSMFGHKLVASTENQTITDETLYMYIKHAINMVETDLGIHVLPRLIRFHDGRNAITGALEARTDIDDSEYLASLTPEQRNTLYIREHGYPYNVQLADAWGFLKLRHRPLLEVLTCKLQDPLYSQIINLLPWVIAKEGLEAKLTFVPQISTLGAFPLVHTAGLRRVNYPFPKFPEAFMVDYKTGYASAADVPKDLVEAIRKITGIMVMSDYGDGKTSALASASASLNSISETFSTTMSATSAMFGARILQWQKDLKLWYKNVAPKYKRQGVGAIG